MVKPAPDATQAFAASMAAPPLPLLPAGLPLFTLPAVSRGSRALSRGDRQGEYRGQPDIRFSIVVSG